MIIPMYFIIALWGGPKRSRAALQFFLFTQLAGFCMLLSIVGVYFIHGRATGVYSFDFAAVLYNGLNGQAAWLLPLGFFLAFAVKMGIVPFHGWLPDAYQQAPFAGGLLLSGIMAKTGAYGLIRIVMPYFHGSPVMVHCAMTLAVATILYGAGMAFSQQNLLRFIAYGSISHMGFALLGIVTWGQLSLQGVVIQMLAHGLIVAGLFMAAAQLESRTGQSSASAMGGLWSDMPRFGGIFLIFALGAAGLPGLPNFIGEFLILLDAFRVSKAAAVASAAGGIVMISSMLWMVQQIFQGNKKSSTFYKDFSLRESTPFFVLIIVMLWLGMFPALFMKTGGPAIDTLLTSSKTTHAAVVNPGALR
jgi:NADH-quinone oxidoreductase subunit M